MPGVARGQWALPRAPRNYFGNDATLRAFHSPHAIQKHADQTPERNVNEFSLWQAIIAGAFVATPGAYAFATLAWLNLYFDSWYS